MYKGTPLTVDAKDFEWSALEMLVYSTDLNHQILENGIEDYKSFFHELDIIKIKIDYGFIVDDVERVLFFAYIYFLIKSGKLKKDKQNYCQLSY